MGFSLRSIDLPESGRKMSKNHKNLTQIKFDAALLGGVALAGGAGLLQEGDHVVNIVSATPQYRKPKDGVGWSDSTPEIEVKYANSDGVISQWLNPVAFLKIGGDKPSAMEDIMAAVEKLKADPKVLAVLKVKKEQLKNMTEEMLINTFFEECPVDTQYNEDEYYLVRRDNQQRVIDLTRSAKGRQIMDRLAFHAGIADEGQPYSNILEITGKEVGIKVEMSSADTLKVVKTMRAEDVE